MATYVRMLRWEQEVKDMKFRGTILFIYRSLFFGHEPSLGGCEQM